MLRSSTFFAALSLFLGVLLNAPLAFAAQTNEPPTEESPSETAVDGSEVTTQDNSATPLPLQDGPKTIALGESIKLELPEKRRFLGQPEAGDFMRSMGNLYNDNLLGVVFPVEEDEDWMVTLRYDSEGFIKDDEKLDGNEILESLREGEDDYNEERRKLGFPALHAEGWLEEPRYDKANHHLVWALIVTSENGSSVNLNTRLLGRKGYVSVNLVADRDDIERYRASGAEILHATTFEPGSRYEDFDANVDKVAEYGLTGLVLGGAGLGLAKAGKVGLLAKFGKGIVALLVVGKKFVLVFVAGIAAAAKKLFSKKSASES